MTTITATPSESARLSQIPIGGEWVRVDAVGGHHYLDDTGWPILAHTRSQWDPRTEEAPVNPPFPIGTEVRVAILLGVHRRFTDYGRGVEWPEEEDWGEAHFRSTAVTPRKATNVMQPDIEELGYTDMADFVADYPDGEQLLWVTRLTREE